MVKLQPASGSSHLARRGFVLEPPQVAQRRIIGAELQAFERAARGQVEQDEHPASFDPSGVSIGSVRVDFEVEGLRFCELLHPTIYHTGFS